MIRLRRSVGRGRRLWRKRSLDRPSQAVHMDIEGGEYTLLPYLLRSRVGRRPVICELDLLVIEFHYKRLPRQVVDQHLEYRDRLGRECPRLRVALDAADLE